MKTRTIVGLTALLALLSTISPQLSAGPLGTAFNYQGRLNDGGNPANGSYDLRLTIYDALSGPGVVAGPLTNAAVAVSSGLFTTTLDFGNVFDGNARWLEIGVRTNGAGDFTTLSPRQVLGPTPYAVYASNASSAATATTASSVGAGAVGGAAIQAGAVDASKIGSGQVVKSVNGLRDGVTLAIGANMTLTTNGQTLTFASSGGGGAGWTRVGSNVYYTVGNVGIGTNNPQTSLHATGTVMAASFAGSGAGLTNLSGAAIAPASITGPALAGDAVTADKVAAGQMVKSVNGLKDDIGLVAGANISLATNGNQLQISATGGGGGGVWGQSDTNIYYTSGRVGIGTNNPQSALHVAGTVTADGFAGSGAGLTGISGAALADGSITSAKIASRAVGSEQLAVNAVASTNIAPGAVGSAALADGAVTSSSIQAGAVGVDKLTTASNWFALTIANPQAASFDWFGHAMSPMGNDRFLIGAMQAYRGATNAGAAYLFSAEGSLLTTFTNPFPSHRDFFGCSLAALGSSRVLIGAYGDNGSSGSVYLFSTNGSLITTLTNPVPGSPDFLDIAEKLWLGWGSWGKSF